MQNFNPIDDVKKFHVTFGHPVLNNPTIPDETRCKLRVELISEELKELQEAIENKDIVEIADALCDIQYVLSGAVLEFGLADKFPALFAEVQRSNMSKAHDSISEATHTISANEKKGIMCHWHEVDGKYVVTRNSDNKVLKNINYSPADLKSIINP